MYSSAAARVVETYEIAFRIFKNVQDDDGNAALLPITLVNHHVGSIALDILWEVQGDLGSLLLVLRDRLKRTPEERFTRVVQYEHGIMETETLKHWVISLKPDSNNKISLSPTDWERLQFYARRIKVLYDEQPYPPWVYSHHLHHDTLCAILAAGGGQALLPNLYHLNVGQRVMQLLETAKLSARYVDEGGERVPYVGLVTRADDEGHSEWLPGNLCRLDRIRFLGLEPDERLAILPFLRDLQSLEGLRLKFLDVEAEEDLRLDSKTERAVGFTGLRELHITNPVQMETFAATLHEVSTEPLKLKELHLTGFSHRSHGGRATEDDYELYKRIRDTCDHDALKRLSVVTNSSGHMNEPARWIYADLLAFPNITHFRLDICAWYSDPTGALKMFTAAWPQLESLVIRNQLSLDPWESEFSFFDLEDLRYLARRCPRLRNLQLDMRLRSRDKVHPPLSGLDGEPLLNRRVALDVGPQDGGVLSSRKYSRRVADFLASVFPYPTLECVCFSDDYREEYWEWIAAEDMRPGRETELEEDEDESEPEPYTYYRSWSSGSGSDWESSEEGDSDREDDMNESLQPRDT
ncbi:uncharacterized protein SCHCODRAFT_02592995 [Schizophyllum commune H4-8]|nr:uncharacterized protein SCHCODRAFT_02592995 [Schizophyllum commune H4-8]KAI5886165.1 hypothetical protein SCHCODRAFT_02592995 [Schizophyllum commune H4-8]